MNSKKELKEILFEIQKKALKISSLCADFEGSDEKTKRIIVSFIEYLAEDISKLIEEISY